VENGRSWSWGRDRASCLIARRWARVKVGGRPPRYRGYSESNPSRLKLCSTSRTRSGLVKVTWAIWATSMPWALSSTICARRQVTTDPVDPAHDAQQPVALLVADLPHPDPLGHPASSRRPDVAGSLHQDAAKGATSYSPEQGKRCRDAALGSRWAATADTRTNMTAVEA
jgi:hypothetical protein